MIATIFRVVYNDISLFMIFRYSEIIEDEDIYLTFTVS